MSSSSQPSPDLIPEDMRSALSKFDEEAGRIVTVFFEAHLAPYQTQPMIYHYTDDVGLRGILESGQLRLTDIFSLNDPSEVRHSLSRAQAIFNKKAASGPAECKLFARGFEWLNKRIHKAVHCFQFSLSERGDDLGQWRAYADNGRGYALGFDTKALVDAFSKNGKTATSDRAAFPVTYEDSALDAIYDQLVKKMLDLVSLPRGKDLSTDAMKEYVVEVSVAFYKHALDAGLYFKHEAYRNEKEYRFLEVHRYDACPEHKLRPRPYSLVRYREFDWKSTAANALKAIALGPAADSEKAFQFAQDCLSEFGLKDVEITRSEIPYRAL